MNTRHFDVKAELVLFNTHPQFSQRLFMTLDVCKSGSHYKRELIPNHNLHLKKKKGSICIVCIYLFLISVRWCVCCYKLLTSHFCSPSVCCTVRRNAERRAYSLQPLIDSSATVSSRLWHLACVLGVLAHSAGEGQRSTHVSFPNM